MVSAETAVTIPAVLAVLVLVLGAATVGLAKADACQVARTAAREASIGQTTGAAAQMGRGSVSRPTSVTIAQQGDTYVATVTASHAFAAVMPARCEVVSSKEDPEP